MEHPDFKREGAHCEGRGDQEVDFPGLLKGLLFGRDGQMEKGGMRVAPLSGDPLNVRGTIRAKEEEGKQEYH